MKTRGPFLIAEDDLLWSRHLTRAVSRYWEAEVARSAGEARQLLERDGGWAGFLFDVRLGDGSGLEVLAHARQLHPVVPALILTAAEDPEYSAQALLLDATFLRKGTDNAALHRWMTRALTAGEPRERLSAAIHAVVGAYGLTRSEEHILELAALGKTAEEIASDRETSVKTVYTQARMVIQKTGAFSLIDAARQVLVKALLGGTGGAGGD